MKFPWQRLREENETLKRAASEGNARIAQLQAMLEGARWELREVRKERPELYHRTPAASTADEKNHANLRRWVTLKGTAADDPLWRAVLELADEHERNARDAALRPGLSDGERQYGAGYAAAADDFATNLRDQKAEAEKKVKG
jgi:hypothetical protein